MRGHSELMEETMSKSATTDGQGAPQRHGIREAKWYHRVGAFFGVIPNLGRVQVFGLAGVGKSVLWESIQGKPGRQEKPYTPTQFSIPPDGPAVIKDARGQYVVKPGDDVGGSDDAFNFWWRALFLQADVVIYLFDLPVFLKKSMSAEFSDERATAVGDFVRDHLVDLANWQHDREKPYFGKKKVPRLVVVGSWCDQHPDWQRDGGDTIRKALELNNRFSRPKDRLVAQGMKVDVLVGSLKSKDSADKLVNNLLDALRARKR